LQSASLVQELEQRAGIAFTSQTGEPTVQSMLPMQGGTTITVGELGAVPLPEGNEVEPEPGLLPEVAVVVLWVGISPTALSSIFT